MFFLLYVSHAHFERRNLNTMSITSSCDASAVNSIFFPGCIFVDKGCLRLCIGDTDFLCFANVSCMRNAFRTVELLAAPLVCYFG